MAANQALAVTDRQQQVLNLLAQGATDREIAFRLKIATRTVRFHVSRARDRLGARSRAEAAVLSHRLGILSGEDSPTQDSPG